MEWFFDNFVDPKSPLFFNKDVILNIIFLALSVLAIAPLTARVVTWKQQREWAHARRVFIVQVRSLIFDFFVANNGLNRFLREKHISKTIEAREDTVAALEHIIVEFDLMASALSARSHSTFANVRAHIDSHLRFHRNEVRKDYEWQKAITDNPYDTSLEPIAPFLVSSEEHADRIIAAYRKSDIGAPFFDFELVFGGLWTMTRSDGLKPKCSALDFLDLTVQVFDGIPPRTESLIPERIRRWICNDDYHPKTFREYCKLYSLAGRDRRLGPMESDRLVYKAWSGEDPPVHKPD